MSRFREASLGQEEECEAPAKLGAVGRQDPYYGVLSLPQFRREHIAENLDTFRANLDRFDIANVSLAKDLGIGGGYDFEQLPCLAARPRRTSTESAREAAL